MRAGLDTRGNPLHFILAVGICESSQHAQGVFVRVMVISRAAAAGDETVAVVKVAGGEVRFAEFEEYAGDGGAAKAVEGSLEEGGGDPPAAEIAMDGDIQDFRFAGGLAGGDEADELAIAFNFANEDNAAGRVG